MNDFDEIDDDEVLRLDSTDDVDTDPVISIAAIFDKKTSNNLVTGWQSSATDLNTASILHDDFKPETVANSGFAIIEIRLTSAFEDLQILKDIRRARPMLPIAALTSNNDSEFISEIFKAGATDYWDIEIGAIR